MCNGHSDPAIDKIISPLKKKRKKITDLVLRQDKKGGISGKMLIIDNQDKVTLVIAKGKS